MKNSSSLLQDVENNENNEPLSLTNSPTAQIAPQSESEPTDLFEFFNGSNNALPQKMMSHAEDIIFCGKLIPIRQQKSREDQSRDKEHAHDCDDVINIVKRGGEERERAGNGHKLKYATQPSSPRSKKYMMMRNSKSLDYEHLRRSLSSDCREAGIRRYSSTRSSDRYGTSGQKVHKPRWYSMLFGLVLKTPPETMELRDMKNRLVKRTPSTMFQSESAVKAMSYPTSTRNRNKTSWGLLSVLSCKDDASIGVTTSFGCVPHVNSCDDIYSRVSCT